MACLNQTNFRRLEVANAKQNGLNPKYLAIFDFASIHGF